MKWKLEKWWRKPACLWGNRQSLLRDSALMCRQGVWGVTCSHPPAPPASGKHFQKCPNYNACPLIPWHIGSPILHHILTPKLQGLTKPKGIIAINGFPASPTLLQSLTRWSLTFAYLFTAHALSSAWSNNKQKKCFLGCLGPHWKDKALLYLCMDIANLWTTHLTIPSKDTHLCPPAPAQLPPPEEG